MLEIPKTSRLKKIGVVAPGSVSEFFLNYPALRTLRQYYPKSHITYIGREWHQRFLAHYPKLVNRVVVLPPRLDLTQKDPKLQEFVRAQQAEHYNLIIQIQDGGELLNQLINVIRPHYSLGLAALSYESLDYNLPYEAEQHFGLRALDCLQYLGIKQFRLKPGFEAGPSEQPSVDEFLEPDKRRIAVLHPGVHKPKLAWNPANFGYVGNWLAAQGFRIVITGSIIERELVESVLYALDIPAEGLVGVLDMPGLIGLIRQSSLVVSNDTGPLHIAQILDIPSVGLYWGSRLSSRGPLWQDKHRAAVSWQKACPKCGAIDCQHYFSWLDSIEPKRVVETIETLILQNSQTSWL